MSHSASKMMTESATHARLMQRTRDIINDRTCDLELRLSWGRRRVR